MQRKSLLTLLGLVVMLVCATDRSTAQELAVSRGDSVAIVNAETAQIVRTIPGLQSVGKLAYRPDGERLGVGMCPGGQIVEYETSRYGEARRHPSQICYWTLAYSPNSQSLAATFLGSLEAPSPSSFPRLRWTHRGRLRIRGAQPLNRNLATSMLPQPQFSLPLLPALAYRPGGRELVIATPRGFTVLSTATGHPTLATVPNVRVRSLSYTTDGARLLVGTSTGFQVHNAGNNYALLSQELGEAVIDIAVASSGGWVALVRGTSVSVRRASDLSSVTQLASVPRWRDADFTSDGSLLAVAEQTGQVRRFQVGTWTELAAIPISGSIRAIALRPQGANQRIPVLFVHGHSGNSRDAWFEPGTGDNNTSFAAALAANPQLPIDAFYLELPLHDGTNNLTRSITDDAQDILAMIEGGLDSQDRTQVGILNMPAYQSFGRVAIVAYSQGTISSRYYIKHLMGDRRSGNTTVSDFVTLAAPNHGVNLGCGVYANQPDRSVRQLCAGRRSTTQTCTPCTFGLPPTFSNNQAGDGTFTNDATFLADLNGHPLADSCEGAANDLEAPMSRANGSPLAEGILYVNLFGAGDLLVGSDNQSVDCVGRRAPRNFAPNAVNREFPGIPFSIHANVPHRWQIICTALKTVTNHQEPGATSPCDGLTPP